MTAKPTMSAIRLEGDPPVAVVVIDRVHRANAIDSQMLGALDRVMTRLERDQSFRVLILTSAAEGIFSAGGDVSEMLGLNDEEGEKFVRYGQRVLDRIASSRLVSIAGINGHTLGGGTELALACDIRVAAVHADIGFPEVHVGLIPGWGGTQRALRLLGPARTKLLVFTGERVSAPEALRIGLVDVVVPQADLLTQCHDIAARIVANSPTAIDASKQAISKGQNLVWEEALAVEAAAWLQNFGTPNRVEGLRAFLERRAPNWT